MADNFLEKRYREVFGKGSLVNPETGFEEKRPAGGALNAYRKAVKNRRIPQEPAIPEVPGTSKDPAVSTLQQKPTKK